MRGLRLITVASVLVGAAVTATPSLAAVSITPQKTWQVANGAVKAIAVLNGKVYVGGTFTRVMAKAPSTRTVARHHLAAFDQSTGNLLPWRPNADRAVYALVARGKTVYAGGAFLHANGRKHRYLAAFDATHRGRLRRWHANTDNIVRALVANRTRLFVGGDFHHLNGKYHKRLGAVAVRSGRLVRWGPRADGRVTALALSPSGTRVYAGGAFSVVSRHKTAHLAAISAGTGKVGRWRSHPDFIVWGIDTYRKRVFVAGGGEGGHLAAYSTGGRRYWIRLADGDFQTVSVSRGTVYGGGHFDHLCKGSKGGGTPWQCNTASATRHKILSVTALHGTLTKWDPQAHGGPIGVWVINAGRKIETGGYFTKWGPHKALITQARFAQFSR
jgi:hypothetical protein